MAKVGYIFNVPHYEGIDKDKAWMMDYGCVNIIEESSDMEAIRPGWKLLMANLERGDELILSKFSNAIRNLSELAFLLETCRIKVIRVISINDKIDSKGKLFPDTTVPQVLNMFGAIPEETAVLRKASAHVQKLKTNLNSKILPKTEREQIVVSMYINGHSIDDIWNVSGFSSRSSVFRILNKHGVKLDRGKFSGPISKRRDKNNQDSSE